MQRPALRRGDMVKRKKPHDDGTMYRVLSMTIPRMEKRKLGLRRYDRVTSQEGFIDVTVRGLDGKRRVFKRRDLWKIPNQPRDRKKKQ